MVVGVCRIVLELPENGSLKDKRRVIKSLLERVRRKFNVAAAEVEDQDRRKRGVIAVACISADRRHADEVLARVLAWVQGAGEGTVSDYQVELL